MNKKYYWTMIGVERGKNGLAKANYVLGHTSDKNAFKEEMVKTGWKKSDILAIRKSLSLTEIEKRLEYLRQELRQERISYSELAELRELAGFIGRGDVELLEAAGVPEFV